MDRDIFMISIKKGDMARFKEHLSLLENKIPGQLNDRTTCDITDIVGIAIYYHNIVAIAHINQVIREYKIKINKDNVLKSIYNVSCYEDSSENPNLRISYLVYDDVPNIKEEYEHLYGHMFSYE